jgi:hypothetical protein
VSLAYAILSSNTKNGKIMSRTAMRIWPEHSSKPLTLQSSSCQQRNAFDAVHPLPNRPGIGTSGVCVDIRRRRMGRVLAFVFTIVAAPCQRSCFVFAPSAEGLYGQRSVSQCSAAHISQRCRRTFSASRSNQIPWGVVSMQPLKLPLVCAMDRLREQLGNRRRRSRF